jgi:predicted acylesterase/phospholipase RssA
MEIEARTGKPVAETFDLIAGTSTGGLLALGLTLPRRDGQARYSAADLLDFYFENGERIFSASLGYKLYSVSGLLHEKYPIEGLEEVLYEAMGNARLKDALTEVIITSYDIENRMAWFFRSWRARNDPNYDFPVVQVARATSAAPTYFQPIQIETDAGTEHYALVDGGVFANNPSMCAYTEALTHGVSPKDIVMVSVGTGTVGQIPGHGINYEKAANWGVLGWGVPIFKVVFKSLGDTVEYQLKGLLPKERYFRLQPILYYAEEAMDKVDLVNMHHLEKDAEAFIERNQDMLDQIAAALT